MHRSEVGCASIWCEMIRFPLLLLGMKTVRIFSDRIRDRIRLERFRSIRIRVRMFNIRYRIRIQILKSYIYDVDIQSYLIRHYWYYPYSNPNSTKNMKTNMISMISVRIRSVFITNNCYVSLLIPFRIYAGPCFYSKQAEAFMVRLLGLPGHSFIAWIFMLFCSLPCQQSSRGLSADLHPCISMHTI